MTTAPERGRAPRVTVLMPVYNGERHLRAAIASILSQTYSDFELLILDDGSTDGSAAIAESYDDARIRLVRQPTNMKLIATLNHGLDLARGEYVARMDADDVSLPGRLARQVAYMDAHPAVGMCGTWGEVIGEPAPRYLRFPTDPEAVRCRLFFGCVFVHSSVMMRRATFEAHGLRYDPAYPHAEDLQLWQRAAEAFPVVNLPEVLVQYRMVPDGICHTHRHEQRDTLGLIDAEALRRFGLSLDADERALFRRLDDWALTLTPAVLARIERLLAKLHAHNTQSNHFPAAAFDALLDHLGYLACHRTAARGHWTLGRKPVTPPSGSPTRRLKRQLFMAARYVWHHGRRFVGVSVACQKGQVVGSKTPSDRTSARITE